MKYYLTGKQAQCIDKYTQETIGIPGLVLMERASERLAESIEAVINRTGEFSRLEGLALVDKLSGFDKNKDKILAVVESGNNGGDAVAAAWMLKKKGYETYIYEIGGLSRQTDSYKTEIQKAIECGVGLLQRKSDENPDGIDKNEEFFDYRIIIDGIFGVGLTREVKGVQSIAIDMINAAGNNGSFIVGADIPSGISSDTGHILGNAVKCDMTVTFEYIKYGMLMNEGRVNSGDIRCESIGLFVPQSINEMASILDKEKAWMLESPGDINQSQRDAESIYINYEYDKSEIKKLIPERKPDSNKGNYGKVLIVAGSREIYGAVYMAAEAAYRVGAGLVKIVTDIRNRDILCDKLPEAMMLTYDTDKTGRGFEKDYIDSIKWADVILAGPGLGTGKVSERLLKLLSDNLCSGQKLILDADALNIISMSEPSKWFKVLTEKTGKGNVIITPHMMEMLRIVRAGYDKKTYDLMIQNLGCKSEMDFLKNFRKSQAYSLSYNNGIITVLKDARTVVAYTTADVSKNLSGYLRECPLYVNTTGNSGMSKGGSGDVLAGMMAGLLAQKRSEEISVADIVLTAVSLHGRAGDIARDRVGERSMMARDILKAIPDCLKE